MSEAQGPTNPSTPAAPATQPAVPNVAVAVPVPAVQAPAIVVPDYIKAMSGANLPGSASVDSMASAAMSIPRVSMRGKKFRFMEGGQEVFACNESVDVVILGAEPEASRFVKTYYDKPYGGAADNSPPTCSSDDGIFPSAWIQTPQHKNCAECPKNRFGSATSRSGKPSKACHDSKRLWVSRASEMTANPKPVAYALGVTVMSLKALSTFGKEMKASNAPISTAITKVIMDDDSEFPMISFKCVGFLPEVQAKTALALAEKAAWKMNFPTRPAITDQSGAVPNVALPHQGAQPTAVAADPGQASAPKPAANMNDVVSSW